MRFNRLDLTRYGRFTDASLPFGGTYGACLDFHIVYGDNEAGKTTTLNAMLDLVFGIEAATPYKFLHQAPAMRLGGLLEIGGDDREVIRLPKTALLDADERPLPEGLFSQDLAGLDRATFQTMFSLDEKTLAAGGESILASRGDLGQLLFSATAGLSDFASALTRLRAETEVFYKAHGRKHDLGDLKKQLLELKERRAAIDVTATPFARLIAARGAAQSAYDAAVRERGRLQAELVTIRRQLATLPQLVEWKRLKADHDVLPDVPPVPEDWPETLGDLQRTLSEHRTRRAAAREEIERLDTEIDALPIDEVGLALAGRIARSAELRARDATAAKDLPDRRAALRAAEAEVTGLLRDLDQETCAAPRRLILPASIVTRLRSSLESWSGVAAAAREATTELADAQARHCEASADVEGARASLEDAAALLRLDGALAAAAKDDGTTRLRLAERTCAAHGDTLAERLRALTPWRGDAEMLVAIEMPSRGERERLARELADAERRQTQWGTETERLSDEIQRATRIRDGVVADRALVDDATAAESRAARDAAWSRHLARLNGDSASTFAQTLRADDAMTAARFAQAADLSELNALNRSLIALTADLELARQRGAAAGHVHRDIEARIGLRLAAFVSVEQAAPLEAFETFLAARDRTLDARDLLRAAEADRAAARAAAVDTCTRLAEALGAVGVDVPSETSLDTLLAAGRSFQNDLQERRARRGRIEGLAREVAERRRQSQRADQEMARWKQAWAETLQGTWLAGEGIGRVRDALPALAKLEAALNLRDGLADRVAKMDADQSAFAAEIRGVADALGWNDVDGAVGDLAERISARSQAASAAAVTRAGKIEDRRRTEGRLSALRPGLEAAEARAREMTALFSVATLDELAMVLDAARRRAGLATRLRALEVEICAASSSERIEDAVKVFAALERDALDQRHAEFEALCEDQVVRAQEGFAGLERARDAVAAIDGDAAAARLEEERRTILLEIEERTMTHLAMRAGIIAAEAAISLYRDRHRSSMMKHASDLFSRLTRGAYSGLAAQTLKDGEVLVGLVAEGGSRLSTEMSTATRHQLYLALRIAAYREFTKTRSAVPFVLDDVLETFDDARAEAALELLGDMAKVGQVIYLTHHRHLCGIARRVCPGAKMYDLGPL